MPFHSKGHARCLECGEAVDTTKGHKCDISFPSEEEMDKGTGKYERDSTEHFEKAWSRTLGHEGDFSDVPDDPGGQTRYGITIQVARANGYHGPMNELPLDEAQEIAKNQYWLTPRLDYVARQYPEVAYEMFDTGYNMGIGMAGKFLQRSLNALNRKGRDFGDIPADGVVGPVTLTALEHFARLRGLNGGLVLCRMMNSLQGARYIELAERNERFETFIYGWFRTRIG